jgi:hypothetical protein
MADATATADQAEDDASTEPKVGPWQLASVLVVIAGLVAIFALALGKYDSNKDTMTGVLGVVVPAFATIGAAVFGVSVGYNAGKSAGEATGKAKGEAGKVQAVADAKRSLATEVLGHLRNAQAPVAQLVSTVAHAGSSDPGVQSFTLGAGDGSVEVPTDTLHGATKGVENAIAACETALRV